MNATRNAGRSAGGAISVSIAVNSASHWPFNSGYAQGQNCSSSWRVVIRWIEQHEGDAELALSLFLVISLVFAGEGEGSGSLFSASVRLLGASFRPVDDPWRDLASGPDCSLGGKSTAPFFDRTCPIEMC